MAFWWAVMPREVRTILAGHMQVVVHLAVLSPAEQKLDNCF